MGVEEEFHLVDARTRRLTARAPELLATLPPQVYVEELQRCVVEVNSGAFADLQALRADLVGHRRMLCSAAAELGMGVVAAGAVPLSVPSEMQVTQTPRYRRMLADYQLLAREQLICGTQVHVDLPDRDEAVVVANRVAPYLAVFLALSSSSPFWADGSDTGYASARTLVWLRWPTTGASSGAGSAAEYDALVGDLVSSGVITDPGMVYFDVRPSTRLPTLELRICDGCPSVDSVVLIAGLFRALVEREVADLRAGVPPLQVSTTLNRAALWRAARSGLEGELVDVVTGTPRPAGEVVDSLVRMLRPQLVQTGDWDTISELARSAVHVGSSASRQRRTLRRRGLLTDVVDLLMAETACLLTPQAEISDPEGTLLHGYQLLGSPPVVDVHDEAVDHRGEVRPEYQHVLKLAAGLGPAGLRKRQAEVEREQSIDGVTFRVSGEGQPQIFPLDVVPRLVPAHDWELLQRGLAQRTLALNAFIEDVYGERTLVHDGVLPPEVLDRAPGLRESGLLAPRGRVRTHFSGVDLVCTGPGSWLVLEDNLRVPSGVAYALANRSLMCGTLPELEMPADVLSHDAVAGMIRDTLLAAAPPRAGDAVSAAVLTSGWQDSAYFEHKLIADQTGLPLVRTENLSVNDGVLHLHHGRQSRRIDVLYVRMDEDMLLSSLGHDGQPLRQGLTEALGNGTLTLANALGNGVGDDKAIYPYVPAMIDYYLGQAPILDQVPTMVCADRAQRDEVLGRLAELVVKPIDGFGGAGITIGPECTDEELAERRVELMTHPERYVAQEVVPLSTHPTFDGTGFYPHHVDLRAFVHLRADGDRVDAHVVPAALTRVAPAGTKIVNTSRGGGGKDTWIQG